MLESGPGRLWFQRQPKLPVESYPTVYWAGRRGRNRAMRAWRAGTMAAYV